MVKITQLRPRRPGLYSFLWKWVWGAIVGAASFLPLLILNGFQFMSLALKPISPKTFRRVNTFIALLIWGWWAWTLDRVIGLKIRYSGDAVPVGESSIVVANHQGMTDIMALICFAFRQKCVQYTKWMVKDALKFVPAIGWGMLFIDCVFLKRNWAQDRSSILATLDRYRSNPDQVWLILFPEGTRMTPDKLARSQAHAIKAKLPKTSNVMLPRTRGFATALGELERKVDSVLVVSISYGRFQRVGGAAGVSAGKGGATAGIVPPTLMEVIRGDCNEIDLHVRRVPIAELPKEKVAQEKWLVDAFVAMDQLLGSKAGEGSEVGG